MTTETSTPASRIALQAEILIAVLNEDTNYQRATIARYATTDKS